MSAQRNAGNHRRDQPTAAATAMPCRYPVANAWCRAPATTAPITATPSDPPASRAVLNTPDATPEFATGTAATATPLSGMVRAPRVHRARDRETDPRSDWGRRRRGFDATTGESTCEQADVAISTFYVYFESKEAGAFGGDDERAAAVEGIHRDRAAGEALHATLRRASHAAVDLDLRTPAELEARRALIAREPRLAAYAAQLQARRVERFARLVADDL